MNCKIDNKCLSNVNIEIEKKLNFKITDKNETTEHNIQNLK